MQQNCTNLVQFSPGPAFHTVSRPAWRHPRPCADRLLGCGALCPVMAPSMPAHSPSSARFGPLVLAAVCAAVFAAGFPAGVAAQTVSPDAVPADAADAPVDPELALPVASAPASPRPRTCLVLSGGGARGMAHIGVLRVLERERVPIDCIVGTSMGAVVGSLYASGLTADEIARQLGALEWGEMFVDRLDRRHDSLRRKAEDRSFLAKGGFGLREGKLGVAPSLFEGQRLAVALRRGLLPSAGVNDFDALPIRFRAVGTDLETGEAVVMDRGDLVNAVRASMAVPGVFAPVSYGERSLIDGGIAMNLPVEVAQALGAERIIAVDIGAGLKTRDQLRDPLSIADQMVTALMLKETARQRERLGAEDVLIVPDLGALGSADFEAGFAQGIPLGVAATEAVAGKLRPLAVDAARYAAWRAAATDNLRAPGPVTEVTLVNTSVVDDAALRTFIATAPGDAVDADRLEEDLARLYGLGELSRAYYVVEPDPKAVGEDGGSTVTFVARSRRWQEDGTLKFGLFLLDDFRGGSEYQLGARYVRRELNKYGGDVLLEARLGDRNRAFAEWHQPLNMGRTVFVRPSLGWDGQNLPLIDEDGLSAQYRLGAWEARAGIGLAVSSAAEVMLVPFVRRNHFDLRPETDNTVPPAIPATRHSRGLAVELTLDTQDDAEFPTRGWYLRGQHTRYLPDWGSDAAGHASRLDANLAFAALDGRWRLGLSAQDRRGDAFENVELLGGPFRLSGYGVDALRGDGAALAALQYSYPIAQVLDYPLFFGGSLEAGQIWRGGIGPDRERFLVGGSLFTALDSPLGPVYFGLGLAEGGEQTLFFRLGQPE